MTDINIDGIVTWLGNWFQEKLVSGTNIKTINNESVLGSGNINISGGGGNVTVDSALSSTSTNPVQNKVIKSALDDKIDDEDIVDNLTTNDTTKVLSAKQGKVLKDIVDDWEGTYLISDDVKLSNLEWSANLTNYLQIQALNLEGGISAICDRYDSQISSLNTSITNIEPYIYDTGWKNLTMSSGFSVYASSNPMRYRRIGKTVHIEGIFKNTSAITPNTTARTFATISDTSCRPSQTQYALQQGSDANKFLLNVNSSGQLQIARYGTTSTNTQIPSGSWLQCFITYFVD